jgi:hypothetical protein
MSFSILIEKLEIDLFVTVNINMGNRDKPYDNPGAFGSRKNYLGYKQEEVDSTINQFARKRYHEKR